MNRGGVLVTLILGLRNVSLIWSFPYIKSQDIEILLYSELVEQTLLLYRVFARCKT